MPTLAVTCRRCGREYEPDPRDVRAGTWRLCPACRDEPRRTRDKKQPPANERMEAA